MHREVYNASVNKMIGVVEPFSRKLCLDKLDDSPVERNHRNGKILFHCRVRFDFIDTYPTNIRGEMRGRKVFNALNIINQMDRDLSVGIEKGKKVFLIKYFL